jgi:hypothetical protein
MAVLSRAVCSQHVRFVRPLSPLDLLPLVVTGMPVAVLFRLCVRSINDLSNAVALAQTGTAGSSDFFLLVRRRPRMLLLRSNTTRHGSGSTTEISTAGSRSPPCGFSWFLQGRLTRQAPS